MAQKTAVAELADRIAQYNLVYRNMHKSLTKVGKIPLAQYYVLLILSRHDQLRMGDISQIMAISRPNLTPLIDKLTEKKLVNRLPDAKDRRVTYISITKTGTDLLQKENDAICQNIEKKLGHLTDDDLRTISNSLSAIMQIAEKV